MNKNFLPAKARLSILILIVVFPIPGRSDPPEEPVWKDFPTRWRADRIGPYTEDIDRNRYTTIYHVSQATGKDWESAGTALFPFHSIRFALSQIRDATRNRVYAILVAEGTYESFRMKEYVDLFGGFESRTWKRNILDHVSVIETTDTGCVVEGADHAVLDGFKVRGGKNDWHGGGILCHRTSPEIRNNVITGNTTLEPVGFVHDPSRRRHVGNDGGGIACVDGAHPIIRNNLIFSNSTEVGGGGGIACRNDSCPKILYNVIWGNQTGLKDLHDTRSSNGGGIYCFAGSSPVVSNNLIANNYAGGRSDGGGLYCEYDSSPVIVCNFILGNHAGDDGGGIEIMKVSRPVIDSNWFAGNRTDQGSGGGIRVSDRGTAIIRNNLVVRNRIAGVYCTNAWMELVNNTIVNNSGSSTGSVFCENERWIDINPPILANNLILTADAGPAFTQGELPQPGYPEPILRNNLISRIHSPVGSDSMFLDDGFTVSVQRIRFDSERFRSAVSIGKDTLLQPPVWKGRVVRIGNRWSVAVSGDTEEIVIWGPFDKTADSMEILPTFHLVRGAPAADAGTEKWAPASDFEGDPRPVGDIPGKVDIGADEFQEVPP